MCISVRVHAQQAIVLQGSRSPSVPHRVGGGQKQTPTRQDCCELVKTNFKGPSDQCFQLPACRLCSAGIFGRWGPPVFIHFFWRVSLAGSQALAAAVTLVVSPKVYDYVGTTGLELSVGRAGQAISQYQTV